MRIAIIGCGWVGERLSKHLTSKGEHTIVTTTSPEKIPALERIAKEVHLLDFSNNPDFSILENVDVAIFSMPISHNDWFEGFKKLDKEFPKTLLFSSTGIYPKENKIFTEKETSGLRSDILAAENLVRKKYTQTTILRFGGLMGDERSLQNMFKNRTPENPQKKANYVHYEDILAVVDLLITSEVRSEIYNVVAPEHPSIAEIMNLDPGKNTDQSSETTQRIISSDHLIQDFNYTFIHPNPKNF